MRSSDLAASVARRWVDAWTTGDLTAVGAMLRAEVTIECNLGWPPQRAAFLDVVGRLAAQLDDTTVLSLTTTDRRAAQLYECRPRTGGSVRLAEFLDLDGDLIVGLRRIYDLTAVDRLLPGLRATAAS
jgi:hypothetical protein